MKLLILALLVMLMVECLGKEQKSKDSKKVDSTKKDGPGKDAKKTDSAIKDDKSKDTKKPSKEKKRKGKHFWFDGKDQWGKQQLDLCFKQTQLPNDYFCYMYYRNYEPKGIDEEGFMKNYLKTYKRRKANTTTIPHKFGKGVARIFRRAQALIPMLNFSLSGPWEVGDFLIEKEGIMQLTTTIITYSSPDQYSKKTREYGNRFVTFALTLKAATWGGGMSGP
ncbi:hypothetical protein COOONC_01082 [Cooperia oncophora]